MKESRKKMAPRDGLDNLVWNKITHYIPVIRPSGHPVSQDVQILFHTNLWAAPAARRVHARDGMNQPSTSR